ncbi:MAG: HAMP domain-containing histidine kinase [Candidatus Gastranaerophilales bacterium]|nr:HAMP domain-containing histidine kinase [Candidatus Gastranaerophilales bacterium]
MIFVVSIVYLVLCCMACGIFLFLTLNKYNKLKSDSNKILLAVKRARYGDINARVENLNDKDLETAANRLFETMYDREMMIKEYQSTLSDKNLSLEKILEQEKQLRQFKEEFAATLTHDMKVPVIAELNSLNYLSEGRFGTLNEKQLQAVNLMKASNQELKDLIENMVETYKLEEKSLKLNITKNLFNEFLKSAIDEMQPIVIQNNHKLIINTDNTKNKECMFDCFQLKRVVKNLIQNALNYSPEESDITIISENQKDKIKLYITNKGQGISEEDLKLIFQKYYTGLSKLRKAGTGLGLYLSNQIAAAHNGNIEADCSKKGFTTFILTIPCKANN